MKYLKSFNENMNSLEIDAICEKYDIEHYNINDDGTIDVDGDVDLSGIYLIRLPLKFRKVTGNFICTNSDLESLEGAPQYVGGKFEVFSNELTSLEYGPIEVNGSYSCSMNKITNLNGAPQSINGTFNCSDNQLKSLRYCPQYVRGSFYCGKNQLTTLKFCPTTVGGSLVCSDNQLTTLKYTPKDIYGDFYCHKNKLTSLEGLPKRIGGYLRCDENNLKNIDYLSDYYKGLNIHNNPISKILQLFVKYDSDNYITDDDIKGLISEFIDREIIQNDIVIIDRLVEFLEDIGEPRTKEYLQNLLENEYETR